FGKSLGGALELAGGQERWFDAQLVERAAQEEGVRPEAEQVELARRGHGERRTGRGDEVLERPVAPFAGGIEVAGDELARRDGGVDLAAQLDRLGEAEVGVAEAQRHAAHGRSAPRGGEAAPD